MARRKKEQNPTPKKGKARNSQSEENMHVDSLTTNKTAADEDGGNSSHDESTYEDSEMLKPEDIQNIVIGDLKTVCVTKATSDDETDTLSKRYRTLNTLPEQSRTFPTNPPTPTVAPAPPLNPTPPPCEHPKKKIVRLMNAAQYFNQDIRDGPKFTSTVGKVEPKELSETYFNSSKVKHNGELLDNSIIRNDSIKSELICDAVSLPPCSKKGEHQNEKNGESSSNFIDKDVSSHPPIENCTTESVDEERDSYQEFDEMLRKTAPILRSLARNLEQMEFFNNSSLPLPTSTPSLQNSVVPIKTDIVSETARLPFKNQSAEILEDFDLSMLAEPETNNTILNPPLSVNACDMSHSTIISDDQKNFEITPSKSDTLGPKSSLETKATPQITTFDFLSCERTGKRFTKSESFDHTSHKPTLANKTVDSKLNDNSTSKLKNEVIPEKLKTDVKQKKSEEKPKKISKKDLNNKQGKKTVENKTIKDEKDRKEAKDSAASEKRRRSTRLKSKPEYEKYEDLNLSLSPALTTHTNKEIIANNLNNASKKENDVSIKSDVKNNQLVSAIISVEPAEMPVFKHIMENEYYTERSYSKDAERMICDCILSREEIIRGERGCGEDCLNRLLLIECCSRCSLGDRCTNKRFQNRDYAKCEVFKTSKKGNGLKVLQDIPSGTFIMEYVGEVIDSDEFERRAMEYAHNKIPHFYFMSLKSDCIIDATIKGNCSRFINHSCEPNAETQKWTVQGELRIGFFSKRHINAGEEVTFDYQLQRYGKQAQRCYCETPSCSGWIGEDPDKLQDDDRSFKEEKKKKKQRDPFVDLETALDEISQVGLINRHQTLSLNRLMVHAKELPVRMQILQLIEEGHPACRRLFVDYHGLPIIWSWMVDCSSEHDELKLQLLKTLMALPITNKTILIDSKVYSLVEQWAFAVDQKIQSEALSAQSVLESVEDIATADETPVSEMAQKVLNQWSSLREAYRIPRKERIQQMKEHEREADQNVGKPRPRRLPLYAEKMRDSYHRNRYNRDKEFDKLYFDNWKRRDSPDSRDHGRKIETTVNRISKMERRHMFEMKVAREKEEKEMIKRQKEEEEKYWLQQSSMYYAGQQHPSIAANQFLTSVPPPNYSTDPVSQVVASQLMQSISSISSAAPSSSHPYYPAAASSYMPPGMMLPHLTAASQSSASQSQSSTPSVMISQQVSPSPTAQSYYQNSAVYQNNAASSNASYLHQNVAELTPKTEKNIPAAYASYDFQSIPSPIDTDAINAVYSTYNDNNSLYTSTNNTSVDNSTTTYASDESKAAALVNAVTAAIDITKIKLPPKWKAARDAEGRVYYYHTKTRISQWYPPAWEEPQQVEEVEQSEVDETSEDESSLGEDDDEESNTAKKRRRQNYDDYDAMTKRRILRDSEHNFDMDAELKENLAAMSSEFQDSDNDEYSPQPAKEAGDQKMDNDELQDDGTPSSNIPLITEHIISPREPIDKEERIRNKKRIKSLKEKLRRRKRLHKSLTGVEEGSSLSSVLGVGGVLGSSHGGVNSISSSDNLLSVPADTSSFSDRKRKDAFRSNMANFVVHCLNPYFRSSCTTARITNYNDFKHLARKLTHFVMLKELKHCRSATELTCNSSVKHKAKEYIRKYMSKFGEIYVRPPDDNINY